MGSVPGEELNFFADKWNKDVIGSATLWRYEQFPYNQSSKLNCFHFFALFSSHLKADNMSRILFFTCSLHWCDLQALAVGCWVKEGLKWVSVFKRTWQTPCPCLSANHSVIGICLLLLGLWSSWLCKAESGTPSEEDVRSKREGGRR